MPLEISGSDWKIFRRLHDIALERLCEEIISELRELTSQKGKGYHERYLEVWKLIRTRDKEIARLFDNPRRSTAVITLADIKGEGLLEPEELAQFSPGILESVEAIERLRSRR